MQNGTDGRPEISVDVAGIRNLQTTATLTLSGTAVTTLNGFSCYQVTDYHYWCMKGFVHTAQPTYKQSVNTHRRVIFSVHCGNANHSRMTLRDHICLLFLLIMMVHVFQLLSQLTWKSNSPIPHSKNPLFIVKSRAAANDYLNNHPVDYLIDYLMNGVIKK